MIESLIEMGRCFFWGLGLLFAVLVVYVLAKSPLISYTPFMAILGVLLPVSAFALVAMAIGAYVGSLIDSLLGIEQVFAVAGLIGGLVTGIALWRRGSVQREA